MPYKIDECNGFELSNCCGATIYDETDVCSDCKEHCDTQCTDCDEPCDNHKTCN